MLSRNEGILICFKDWQSENVLFLIIGIDEMKMINRLKSTFIIIILNIFLKNKEFYKKIIEINIQKLR